MRTHDIFERILCRKNEGKVSKETLRCMRHKKHVQELGVCSYCLNDRLSRLLSKQERGQTVFTLRKRNDYYESSSSSSLSSSSSSCHTESSCSSPMEYKDKGGFIWSRKGSRSLNSLFMIGKSVLKKSKSE